MILSIIGLILGSMLRIEHTNGYTFNIAIMWLWPFVALSGLIITNMEVFYFMTMVTIGWVGRVYDEMYGY